MIRLRWYWFAWRLWRVERRVERLALEVSNG